MNDRVSKDGNVEVPDDYVEKMLGLKRMS